MPKNAPKPSSNAPQIIDRLLDDLASMADRDAATEQEFFDRIFSTIVPLFSPDYSAVLAKAPSGENLVVFKSKSIQSDLLIPEASAESSFSKFVQDDAGAQTAILEALDQKSIAFKVATEQGTWGGLVATFKSGANIEPLVPIFDAICEITAQFIANRWQATNVDFVNDFLRFSVNSHTSLDPKRVASHLANDARRMLGCERLSIFQVFRNRASLLAVSSVAGIENRSKLAKKMTHLAKVASRLKTPVFAGQPPTEKRLNEALQSFQLASGFPFLVGIPLVKFTDNQKRVPKIIGYAIAESDENIDRFQFSRNLQLTAPHMGLALSNACQVSRIPFRRSLSLLGKLKDTFSLAGLLTTTLLLTVGIWCVLFLKTDFQVRINGELRPEIERVVFAPADGFVEHVLVDHGDKVAKNQVLIELSSPTLNLELEQFEGERLKMEKILETKKIALNQANDGNRGDLGVMGQLASEISELEHELDALDEKSKFIDERIKELVIQSPIDGRVTTWQLKRNILSKPVRWGDDLANIADENGVWKLNFKVPEYRIGYLLDARNQSSEPLEIEFFFESNPSRRMKTKILEIEEATKLDPEYGPSVTIVCELPATEGGEFVKRHGARVIADVNCGQRSLLATWTQELVDSIRRKLVW